MFTKILIPLDLTGSDSQQRSISVATELAKSHGAELHAVNIGSGLPDAAAKTEAGREAILNDIVSDMRTEQGVDAIAHEIHSVDPGAEIDKLLIDFVDDNHIDLIVMSSHEPGMFEHFFPGHGGYIASHSKASVFVVR